MCRLREPLAEEGWQLLPVTREYRTAWYGLTVMVIVVLLYNVHVMR